MAFDDGGETPREMLNFVLRQGDFTKAGLRLGQLARRGGAEVATPTFIASTSRGIIPHITQDVMSKLIKVPAVYIGLEDCKSSFTASWHRLTDSSQLIASYRENPSKGSCFQAAGPCLIEAARFCVSS